MLSILYLAKLTVTLVVSLNHYTVGQILSLIIVSLTKMVFLVKKYYIIKMRVDKTQMVVKINKLLKECTKLLYKRVAVHIVLFCRREP